MLDNRCPRCNGHGSYGWNLCRLCKGTGEEETKEMSEMLVLFGAGAAGRYALRFLREKGIEPVAFADNDEAKWDTIVDGVRVNEPSGVWRDHYDAVWVACAISRSAATEIRAELRAMGVKTKPLWECIPVCHGVPPQRAIYSLYKLLEDTESRQELLNQRVFRESPDYDVQRDPSPISELYFPNFITPLVAEHFVDCGAADGDTVNEFLRRWPIFDRITAFEPDRENYSKLLDIRLNGEDKLLPVNAAVSDFSGVLEFCETGDYSAHIIGIESRDDKGGSTTRVECCKLDDVRFPTTPTYIKVDIEGSELEMLWGARKLLKEHSPVLAICAYHTSDHLWEIPLLIHAINPDYRLYFRRYAEGAFEIVWYGVPQDRIRV